MDPNATLAEIRGLLMSLEDGLSVDSALDAHERMADLVEALDEWLTRGGILPSAWQHS